MRRRVGEILNWYGEDGVETATNFTWLLNHGRLARTGRLVILPADARSGDRPVRSFILSPNS